MNQEKTRGEIIIYQTLEGENKIEVKMEEETVWLNQTQIAELFGIERSVVAKHLNNTFKTKELNQNSVCAKIAQTGTDSKTYQVIHYNLDAIISVGYRTNSLKATQFRIWANSILKDYLTKGFAINKKLLEEQNEKLKDIQEAIKFINDKKDFELLKGREKELIYLIQEFANSFSILHDYDEEKLELSDKGKTTFTLTYDGTKQVIADFKEKLAQRGEAGSLMGSEIGDKFKSVVGTIYQTFDSIDLYSSLEEKAANLLYLTIKDHPFSDGNKRIGSLLFVYFLSKNNYLHKESGEKKINDNTLVAIALLVAVSDPRDKETMIKIISNLLK